MKQFSQISAYKFFATAAIAMGILLAMVAGLNLLINPFGFYELTPIDGVNVYKPEIFTRVRLFKAFEVRRIRPETIILGSSRTHVGLSCSHQSLKSLNESCYNLAFDGATTREMYAYLKHAQAIHPLKHVVLGLDSYHTSYARSFTRPDFDDLILYDGNYPWLPRWLTADLRLLTSLNTLASSIKTLRAQAYPEPNWFASDGQRLGAIFFRRPNENFMLHGPRAYFEEIDRLEIGFQTEGSIPGRAKTVTANALPDITHESSIAYIRKIVDFCRLHKIDLRIFITPAHVHQLEITAAVGGWTAIEDGKRALVNMLSNEASQHIDSLPVPLFDFNGYSEITMEALPPKGSRDEMKYYWESSHFKDILGQYLLDRLFSKQNAQYQGPSDFGMQLTPDTIEPWLVLIRKIQTDYRIRFADEVSALNKMVRDAQIDETTDQMKTLE